MKRRLPRSVAVALERLGRQPGRAPGLKAAVEVRRAVVPELLERRGGEARLVAGVAHDDQRAPGIGHALVAVRTVGVAAPLEHVARDEHAAGHDAVAPALALGADVDRPRPGVDGRARASRVDPSQPRPGPLEELVDPAHEGSLQSTAPATSVWLPSGRPRTSRAARAACSSASRSTPVSMPISWSIETRSSVAMLPVAPAGTGQPPSSPKEDSKESMATSSAASTLARPWPRVLWKCAVSSTSSSRTVRACSKKARTCSGLAIPVVSPKPPSCPPARTSRPAISSTRSGATWPSYGQPKATEITASQ